MHRRDVDVCPRRARRPRPRRGRRAGVATGRGPGRSGQRALLGVPVAGNAAAERPVAGRASWSSCPSTVTGVRAGELGRDRHSRHPAADDRAWGHTTAEWPHRGAIVSVGGNARRRSTPRTSRPRWQHGLGDAGPAFTVGNSHSDPSFRLSLVVPIDSTQMRLIARERPAAGRLSARVFRAPV